MKSLRLVQNMLEQKIPERSARRAILKTAEKHKKCAKSKSFNKGHSRLLKRMENIELHDR